MTTIAELEAYANAGDRESYYAALAAAGDMYGSLAGGVANQNTLSGKLGQSYMEVKADDFKTSSSLSRASVFKDLVTESWALHFNPARADLIKLISFNQDGTIGEGRNANEYTWNLEGDTLAIFRANGALQNRFKKSGNKFFCTNDTDALGIKDQVIYHSVPLVGAS